MQVTPVDNTLKPNIGSYFQENDNKFSQQGERSEQPTKEPRNEISETVSEDKITPVKPLSNTQIQRKA